MSLAQNKPARASRQAAALCQGGAFGCTLPAGHSGPHEVAAPVTGLRKRSSEEVVCIKPQAQHKKLCLERLHSASSDAEYERVSDEIAKEDEHLNSLNYEKFMQEKRAFMSKPVVHPQGRRWGEDWPARVSAALRDAPVRSRYLLDNCVPTTNVGRVVGCIDHTFQIAYEDGYRELLPWIQLKEMLVPLPRRDVVLAQMEERGELARTSARHRPSRKPKVETVDDYVPRLGCHYSLPPGKVACHVHEQLRLSRLFEEADSGPLPSD